MMLYWWSSFKSFFNKEDLPWVHLLWDNYYSEPQVSRQYKRGSFWWRGIIKLLDQYKGIVEVKLEDASTVQFWHDSFVGVPIKIKYPELFSFAKDEGMYLQKVSKQLRICIFVSPTNKSAVMTKSTIYSWPLHKISGNIWDKAKSIQQQEFISN